MNTLPASGMPGCSGTYQISLIHEETASRLRQLYEIRNIQPGKLDRIFIRPGWLVITGTNEECGAAPFAGADEVLYNGAPGAERLRSFVGLPLLLLAGLAGQEADPLHSSLKLAVLSALSQPFLGCPGIRQNGWHAECWKAQDVFVQEYPVLDRLIRPDDTVAVAGYAAGTGRIREFCRELHIVKKGNDTRFDVLCIGQNLVHGPRDIHVHEPCAAEAVLGSADVVIISSYALTDNTFGELMGYAKNARLTGLVGPGASILPDAFFNRGIAFIQSGRIVDPLKFIDDLANDTDVETAIKRSQKQFLFVARHNEPDKNSLPLKVSAIRDYGSVPFTESCKKEG